MYCSLLRLLHVRWLRSYEGKVIWRGLFSVTQLDTVDVSRNFIYLSIPSRVVFVLVPFIPGLRPVTWYCICTSTACGAVFRLWLHTSVVLRRDGNVPFSNTLLCSPPCILHVSTCAIMCAIIFFFEHPLSWEATYGMVYFVHICQVEKGYFKVNVTHSSIRNEMVTTKVFYSSSWDGMVVFFIHVYVCLSVALFGGPGGALPKLGSLHIGIEVPFC